MNWLTLTTMFFTIGSVYGGLGLMLGLVFFRRHNEEETSYLDGEGQSGKTN